jgi:hypothetical protein
MMETTVTARRLVDVRRLIAAASVALVVAALALVPSSALAKSCSAGYVHGTIGGVQKCLRRGEYCAHAYASQYHHYGFNCVIVSGEYHLEPRSLHRLG